MYLCPQAHDVSAHEHGLPPLAPAVGEMQQSHLMVDGSGDPNTSAEYAHAVEALHAFIAEDGCERRGKHHEICLGDPRRTAPERLRTIIRQPVEPKG
jgi:hypothetical protein